MTIDEFRERVIDALPNYLPGVCKSQIKQAVISRANNVVVNGIKISLLDTNLSLAVNLDLFYDKVMKEGKLFNTTVKEIADYFRRRLSEPPLDLSSIYDYEKVKDKIVYKILNYRMNKEMLRDFPHMKCGDFAKVYMIELSDSMQESSGITIPNELFNDYGVSIEELDAVAHENMKRLCPMSFVSNSYEYSDLMNSHTVKSMLADLYDMDENEITGVAYGGVPSFCILSSERKVNGASLILENDVVDTIAKQFGNKFLVFFSSVHEAVITKFDEEYTKTEQYERMIQNINETMIPKEEVLSDKVYVMDANNHKLVPMKEAKEYFNKLEKQKQAAEKINSVVHKRETVIKI